MKSIVPFALALFSLPVFAEAPPAAPSPPEVKKTVEAFAGEWELATTIKAPGAPVQNVAERMTCTRQVQGRAVNCTSVVTGAVSHEASLLIGYDVEEGKVRVFGISSDPSVHDHVCRWKDEKEIACDPLKALSHGKPVTEDLSFAFSGGTLKLNVIVTMDDGKRLVVESAGKRKK